MLSMPRGILPLALLVALAPLAGGQEGETVRSAQVQAVMERCKGAGASDIWKYSEELVAMGASAKRTIQEAVKGASTEGRLAALRALIELDSPTFAAERLMEMAEDEALALDSRLIALELVGLTEEIDAEEGLLELVVALNPQIRLAAARALWRLDAPRSHKAKTVLREFLKSTEGELRAQGALALAEIGDAETPGVTEVLQELRKEPGVRGQLASALYHRLQLQRTVQLLSAKADAAGVNSASRTWQHLDEIKLLLGQVYDSEQPADETELRARAARGMMHIADDPHTMFLTPEEYHEFLHGSDGVDPSYGGIGAFIDTNVRDSFRILRPIFDGPAWKADLRSGDDIIAVDGEPTAGRTNTDIIKQVKGPPGTPVKLTIAREGATEPLVIEVIRAKIVMPTVFWRMLPGEVGYVMIAQFAYETGRELQKALHDLASQGVKGLVIDLRENPGGLLTTVKECLAPFLKEGDLICTVRGRAYQRENHVSARAERVAAFPISVLINERSASGAELMSGVLQHYSKRSGIGASANPYLDVRLFGAPTFGKGTVQHTVPLRSWPGEKWTDTPRKNGFWDYGEPMTDQNGNRRWDPGEPFEDRPAENGRWDDAEPWEDKNGNGVCDPGESFTDENGDGIWNAAESFEDRNQNGRYDTGAAVKLTVARYYLPDGRNFTRSRIFRGGEFVYEGGVVPDVASVEPRLPVNTLVEIRDLQVKGKLLDYVKSRWKEHRATFEKLAWFDGRDPARYPDFDAFHAALGTHLSRQELRRAVRIEVRREVANAIGREILGDLSDDETLRRGVLDVLARLEVPADTIEEYRSLEGNGASR